MFQNVRDGDRAGHLSKADVAPAKHQETKRINGIDVVTQEDLEEMLTNELNKMLLPKDMPTLLRTKYANRGTFWEACGLEDKARSTLTEKVDLTWQGPLSTSAFKYGQLVEQTIYANAFNGAVRQCIINSKNAEDTPRRRSSELGLQRRRDGERKS